MASLNIDYNLWWAAVNLSADDVELKTTWSHKGPGADTKDSARLVYDAESIVLFFTTHVAHTKAGPFKSSVKISGSSNSKNQGRLLRAVGGRRGRDGVRHTARWGLAAT